MVLNSSRFRTLELWTVIMSVLVSRARRKNVEASRLLLTPATTSQVSDDQSLGAKILKAHTAVASDGFDSAVGAAVGNGEEHKRCGDFSGFEVVVFGGVEDCSAKR